MKKFFQDILKTPDSDKYSRKSVYAFWSMVIMTIVSVLSLFKYIDTDLAKGILWIWATLFGGLIGFTVLNKGIPHYGQQSTAPPNKEKEKL